MNLRLKRHHSEALPISANEIERRNRYWFEHPDEFTCDVLIRQDHVAGHVGGFAHVLGPFGAFGSMPVHTMGIVDRGRLAISGPIVTVFGQRNTWQWDLRSTNVVYDPNGGDVEMRVVNRPVIVIQGPVSAPIVGAGQRYRSAQ